MKYLSGVIMIETGDVIVMDVLLGIVLSTNDDFLVSFKVILGNFEVEL